jgi:hypothetical protein
MMYGRNDDLAAKDQTEWKSGERGSREPAKTLGQRPRGRRTVARRTGAEPPGSVWARWVSRQ